MLCVEEGQDGSCLVPFSLNSWKSVRAQVRESVEQAVRFTLGRPWLPGIIEPGNQAFKLAGLARLAVQVFAELPPALLKRF